MQKSSSKSNSETPETPEAANDTFSFTPSPWVSVPHKPTDEGRQTQMLNQAIELYAQLRGESVVDERDPSVREAIVAIWSAQIIESIHRFWTNLEEDLQKGLEGDQAAARRVLNLPAMLPQEPSSK